MYRLREYGFLSRGSYFSVITRQSSFGSNILSAEWNMRGDMVFNATITARGIDRKGMLKDVTTLLADIFDIDIHRLSTICDDGIFNSEIEFKVKNNKLLEIVADKLLQIDGMQSVHRV